MLLVRLWLARRPAPRPHAADSAFFFQAEDGIRDKLVTGVHTCALPISSGTRAVSPTPMSGRGPGRCSPVAGSSVSRRWLRKRPAQIRPCAPTTLLGRPPIRVDEIGRASCRERVLNAVGGESRSVLRNIE